MNTQFMINILHTYMKIIFLGKYFHEMLVQLRIFTGFNNVFWNGAKSVLELFCTNYHFHIAL